MDYFIVKRNGHVFRPNGHRSSHREIYNKMLNGGYIFCDYSMNVSFVPYRTSRNITFDGLVWGNVVNVRPKEIKQASIGDIVSSVRSAVPTSASVAPPPSYRTTPEIVSSTPSVISSTTMPPSYRQQSVSSYSQPSVSVSRPPSIAESSKMPSEQPAIYTSSAISEGSRRSSTISEQPAIYTSSAISEGSKMSSEVSTRTSRSPSLITVKPPSVETRSESSTTVPATSSWKNDLLVKELCPNQQSFNLCLNNIGKLYNFDVIKLSQIRKLERNDDLTDDQKLNHLKGILDFTLAEKEQIKLVSDKLNELVNSNYVKPPTLIQQLKSKFGWKSDIQKVVAYVKIICNLLNKQNLTYTEIRNLRYNHDLLLKNLPTDILTILQGTFREFREEKKTDWWKKLDEPLTAFEELGNDPDINKLLEKYDNERTKENYDKIMAVINKKKENTCSYALKYGLGYEISGRSLSKSKLLYQVCDTVNKNCNYLLEIKPFNINYKKIIDKINELGFSPPRIAYFECPMSPRKRNEFIDLCIGKGKMTQQQCQEKLKNVKYLMYIITEKLDPINPVNLSDKDFNTIILILGILHKNGIVYDNININHIIKNNKIGTFYLINFDKAELTQDKTKREQDFIDIETILEFYDNKPISFENSKFKEARKTLTTYAEKLDSKRFGQVIPKRISITSFSDEGDIDLDAPPIATGIFTGKPSSEALKAPQIPPEDLEKVNTVKQFLTLANKDDPDKFLMQYQNYIKSIKDKNAKLEVYNAVKNTFGNKFDEEDWDFLL